MRRYPGNERGQVAIGPRSHKVVLLATLHRSALLDPDLESQTMQYMDERAQVRCLEKKRELLVELPLGPSLRVSMWSSFSVV